MHVDIITINYPDGKEQEIDQSHNEELCNATVAEIGRDIKGSYGEWSSLVIVVLRD